MTREALRVGRFSQAGGIYLVTTATAGRLPVFADFHCARRVICEMRRVSAEGVWCRLPGCLCRIICTG